MWKWILGILCSVLIAALVVWFNIDKSVRYLYLNPPETLNILMWDVPQRDAAFRSIEALGVQPLRIIDNDNNVKPLASGTSLPMPTQQLDKYFEDLRIAGLVVIHDGELVLERYGLDFQAGEKWTSFSVAKSFTSTLVGAAVKDGYIKSLDDKVALYVPELSGSVYEDVSIEQLMTMTSGVKWNEDYSDPESDVSRFNFHRAPEGVDVTVSYMKTLSRAHPPGVKWLYSTGETNLIGVVLSRAIGKPLAEYLTQKVWQHLGAEKNASWLLGDSGHEISGCCIQATTKDFAKFGQFILDGAMVNGESIVPDDWFDIATANQITFDDSERGYGYQWWTNKDGTFQARGIFGQGIFIDPSKNLVIALNSNWPTAGGSKYTSARSNLYRDIQKLVVPR